MAIPLSMPNSEDIEDGHRLDLLLEQLLITLRQVLIHRRRVAAAAVPRATAPAHARHRHSAAERTRASAAEPAVEESTRVSAEEEPASSMQLPLPDLVMDSPSAKESDRAARGVRHAHGASSDPSWAGADGELIRLAGQLLEQEEVDAKGGAEMRREEKRKVNVLSMMCPLLGNSVWTTVALLVVWGLLSHAR